MFEVTVPMNAELMNALVAERLVVDASMTVDEALVRSVKRPLVNESDVPPKVVAVALVMKAFVA